MYVLDHKYEKYHKKVFPYVGANYGRGCTGHNIYSTLYPIVEE